MEELVAGETSSTPQAGTLPPLVVANNTDQVRVYDLQNHSSQLLGGHTDIVLGVSVSFDGRFLATCSKDATARLYYCGPLNADDEGDVDEENAHKTSTAHTVGHGPLEFRFCASYLCLFCRFVSAKFSLPLQHYVRTALLEHAVGTPAL